MEPPCAAACCCALPLLCSTARLAVLESMLRWRHMAPTAPDTLACYPFADNDPFILHKCPHVFFAGNQPAFETRLLQGEAGWCGVRVWREGLRGRGGGLRVDGILLSGGCGCADAGLHRAVHSCQVWAWIPWNKHLAEQPALCCTVPSKSCGPSAPTCVNPCCLAARPVTTNACCLARQPTCCASSELGHVAAAAVHPPLAAFRTHFLRCGCGPCACPAGDGGQLVRLVAVPSFLTSGTLVLVNLRTLAATPITFRSS